MGEKMTFGEKCLFCKIIAGELACDKVWENERFSAFLDINPVNPGHFMLVPKRHVDYFFDLSDAEYREAFEIAKKLQGPLKRATNAKRIGLVIEGFAVPHAHLHLVPIHKPNDIDPCKSRPGVPEEMKQMAAKIKYEISKESLKGRGF